MHRLFASSCSRSVVVFRPHAAELLAAEAFDGGGGDHGFGAAADADVGVDAGLGEARRDGGGYVAVADQADAAADGAEGVDDRLMARAIEDDDHEVADALAELAGDDAEVGFERGIDLYADIAFGDGLADGDLLHVVRRDRGEQMARVVGGRCAGADGEDRDRAGQTLGRERRAVDWVDGDGGWERAFAPGADFFVHEDSGGFVFQTFADAHEAFEVDQAEHAAHGVGGGAVGLVLVAFAEVFPGGQRGVLGAADEVEVDDAFGVVADGWHGGRFQTGGRDGAVEDARGWDEAFVVLPCSLHPASSVLYVLGHCRELDFLFQKLLIVQGRILQVLWVKRVVNLISNYLNIGI